MQALIDFDGWRKWKDFSQAPKNDTTGNNNNKQPSPAAKGLGKVPSPSGKNGGKEIAVGGGGGGVGGGMGREGGGKGGEMNGAVKRERKKSLSLLDTGSGARRVGSLDLGSGSESVRAGG